MQALIKLNVRRHQTMSIYVANTHKVVGNRFTPNGECKLFNVPTGILFSPSLLRKRMVPKNRTPVYMVKGFLRSSRRHHLLYYIPQTAWKIKMRHIFPEWCVALNGSALLKRDASYDRHAPCSFRGWPIQELHTSSKMFCWRKTKKKSLSSPTNIPMTSVYNDILRIPQHTNEAGTNLG